ncbi:hypothetical protein [Alteromonas oceanisediminis]|uniref:hypothetical protein n=1 Tax=Alteromonas oceanisediminis TaxID=2836180 RepID=UPI001BDAE15F|nr:hypothetical protein [Alteromonas oceanisediminis]MBT0586417.1 hypothetical protein [Alteromonas oceanisediminis]
MALPLIWLGAGVLAAVAGTKLSRDGLKSRGDIKHFPGECRLVSEPANGSVVCCGIYEVFQHSGIWVDGNIIELRGNGLVRAISPQRFLKDRSGNRIYVACDESRTPLVSEGCAARAIAQVYQFADYDVIGNNCHRFSLQCVLGYDQLVTRFGSLNAALRHHFNTTLYWQPITD